MRTIAALLLAAVLVGGAPAATPRLIDAVDGVAVIAWENTTGADSVVVANLDGACPYPVVMTIDPTIQHVVTQVPEGPPFEQRCLLRPGDRLYMQRYLHNFFVDQEGPFVVARSTWLPVVGR